MSNLHDEETTSEHHDIGKKLMNHMKKYSFFIYYQKAHIAEEGNTTLNIEKMSFKLRQDKSLNEKYYDYNKNVHIHFFNIEDQIDVSNSLHDLKLTAQQTKTKLIFFTSQSQLVSFYLKAKVSHINIENIPFCLYTSGIHCDLSKYLGWGQSDIKNFSSLSANEMERYARKWVQSPPEKIDIWAAEMKVSQEGGSIQKLNDLTGTMYRMKQNSHKQLFLSNLSVGYHPNLLLSYEQRKSNQKPSLFDKIIYSFQGLKKFCCVGSSDMRQSTGVVKIDFVDQKGQHQILKYLRDAEGEQDSEYLASKKQGNKRKVLSILLSNINQFFGEKVKTNDNSKMNDQKLQLITFQSKSQSTVITSISGQISMQFSPDHPVFVQVNDSCFRLNRPLEIKVQSFGKGRIIINKETLSC